MTRFRIGRVSGRPAGNHCSRRSLATPYQWLTFQTDTSIFHSILSGAGVTDANIQPYNLPKAGNILPENTMAPILHSIDHINIVVKNLEEVKRFFVALGFEIKDQSRLHGQWISNTVGLENVDAEYAKLTLPGDGTSLELIQFKNPPTTDIPNPGQANTQGLRHLALQVADIEAAVTFLKQQGIEPVSAIQEYAPAKKKLVYFKGPEDILLELAQYG